MKILTSLSALTALYVCISTSAVADTLYPGSMCHPRIGNETQFANNYYSELTNVKPSGSNDSMGVVCPLPRTNSGSTAAVEVWARVHNRNASTPSTCFIMASDWRGQNTRTGPEVTVRGADNFGALTVGGPASHSGGSLQMFCILSRGSQLMNYLVRD